MYNITCYKNTGFNPINIPDSPALVDSMPVILTQGLDVLQDRGLNSVRVRSTYNAIKDCDYCKIGDTYYSVVGVSMAAVDTAVLSLVFDAITTAGGPENITYLDGLTERHTVSDDDLFEYTQSDEYCTPMQQLQMESAFMSFGSADLKEYVETTIDISALISQFDASGNFNGDGKTFTDGNSGDSVVVPVVTSVEHDKRTTYQLNSASGSGGINVTPSTTSADTQVWDAGTTGLSKAIGIIRSLGIESGILNQVFIPSDMVAPETSAEDGAIPKMNGYVKDTVSPIDFGHNYSGTIHNQRVYYGQYNMFGLISASGAKCEFLPEEIGSAGDVAPTVRMVSDPRLDGKPYFRFKKYLGDDSFDGFWISCISGLQWASAPLVWSGQSGSYQNREQVKVSLSKNSYENTAAASQADLSQYQALISSGAGMMQNLLQGNFAGALGSGIQAAGQLTQYDLQNQVREGRYKYETYKELQNYGMSASINAPSIEFPFSANAIRDFVGNGVFIYRYYYTDTDAERVDKLLTMYGYKDTAPLSSSLFHQRQYFDYVRANGVSIGGNLNQSFKQTIAEQLNAGVRVWHVKPNASYYTSGNPIRSE